MKKKKRRNFSYFFGNFLIVGSLMALLIIYMPLLVLFLSPPKILARLNNNYYLTIPKISAQAPIIENVDPYNESEYLGQLSKGIADAKGSVNPGQNGLIYLFAHSSDYPWNITRYNVAFFKLGDLQNGDKVVITKDNQNYNYQVFDKKELWPNQTEYLNELNLNKEATFSAKVGQTLILQTCTPIGTSIKRLLVFAKKV